MNIISISLGMVLLFLGILKRLYPESFALLDYWVYLKYFWHPKIHKRRVSMKKLAKVQSGLGVIECGLGLIFILMGLII